jgi:hypothetical protein
MTGIEEFAADLSAGGFIHIKTTDLTNETKPFVVARLAAWREDAASLTQDYGEDAYASLEKLYATVARLFENGSLGCVRLVAVTGR